MRVIYIQARYSSTRSELAGASTREVALAIESAVSVALLELCGAVEVERVQVVDERDADVLRATDGSLHLRERSQAKDA